MLAVAAESAVPVAIIAAAAAASVGASAVRPVAPSTVASVAVIAATAAFGEPVVVPVAAATSSSAAPARPGRPSSSSSAAALDVFPGHCLLDLHAVALDGVELDHGGLVGGVVVLEVDEAEAALLAALLVRDDLGLLDGAELAEVLHQVVLAQVPLQAADEELLHFGVGAGPGRVLAGDGALQLHRVAVHGVRGGGHGRVGLLHGRVGDEAEASGALGLRVQHHHAVGEGAVGREVLAQPCLRRLHVQAADEQLTQLGVLHAGAAAAAGLLRASSLLPPAGGSCGLPKADATRLAFVTGGRAATATGPSLTGRERGKGVGKRKRTRTKWRLLLLLRRAHSRLLVPTHKGNAQRPAHRGTTEHAPF